MLRFPFGKPKIPNQELSHGWCVKYGHTVICWHQDCWIAPFLGTKLAKALRELFTITPDLIVLIWPYPGPRGDWSSRAVSPLRQAMALSELNATQVFGAAGSGRSPLILSMKTSVYLQRAGYKWGRAYGGV